MNERRYYSQEAKTQARRETVLLIAFALSVGVGIGSALALLFAPKSGDDLRDDLAHMMEKRVGGLEEQVKEVRNKLEERVSQRS